MSNNYLLNIKKNNWTSDNHIKKVEKVPIDEWWIEREYPFEIKQRYMLVQPDGPEPAMNSTPGISQNSTHGSYGSTSIDTIMLYDLRNSSDINEHQTNKAVVKYWSTIFKHLESAECARKEMLIEHYTHKLSKTSKKKDEFKILTDIVTKLKKDVCAYMDKYPERCI